MARNSTGRHRAPGYNPLNELTDIAARATQPALKASAVAVASGGLVAAFAIPASAAPAADNNTVALAASAPQAAPLAQSETVAVAAPAVKAHTAAPAFGVIGFTGKAAPKPVVQAVKIKRVKQVTTQAPTTTRASRSTNRTAVSTAAQAPAQAPAPVQAPVQQQAPAYVPPATGGVTGIAASLGGIPYVYGGTSTSGFDCSGFTGYVYARAGKSIPRTAEAQRSAATKVTNPQPGDLIFFGFPAYHVGIYAGGNQMYDSQKPGTVTGLHVIWTQKSVSYGRF